MKLEPEDSDRLDAGSFLSGTSFDGAPVDKQGTPMILFGQLDFLELRGCFEETDSKLPDGILKVFLSPNYKQFRHKEAGWFKTLFSRDNANIATQTFPMRGRLTFYLPPDFDTTRSQSDHSQISENHLNEKVRGLINNFNEYFVGTDYILGEPDKTAVESCVIAAFHANGISYDDKRRNDSCYRHLVEDAASWRVLWKSGRVCLVFPEEKRELYICIRSDDLQNGDFSKCLPVFL